MTKISHRGRKRLRYWLFQAAKSAVSRAKEFKILHEYYTTRPENPLKKMQSHTMIACKILKVIFAILRTSWNAEPMTIGWRLGRILEKDSVNDDVEDMASAATVRRDHGGIVSAGMIIITRGTSSQQQFNIK